MRRPHGAAPRRATDSPACRARATFTPTRCTRPGQQRSPDQFDAHLLRVARDDSLLNAVPRLLPAVLDAAGAAADLLGELHFSDPYLTR